MPIALPSSSVSLLAMPFAPVPVTLYVVALLAVVGVAALVLAVLRTERRGHTEPPVIVTTRRPRVAPLPEAA